MHAPTALPSPDCSVAVRHQSQASLRGGLFAAPRRLVSAGSGWRSLGLRCLALLLVCVRDTTRAYLTLCRCHLVGELHISAATVRRCHCKRGNWLSIVGRAVELVTSHEVVLIERCHPLLLFASLATNATRARQPMTRILGQRHQWLYLGHASRCRRRCHRE